IPLSVLSSRVSQGRAARRDGLFVIPEERRPPPEIRRARELALDAARLPGFVEAVVEPETNRLMCTLGLPHARQPEGLRQERLRRAGQALSDGPQALADDQKL